MISFIRNLFAYLFNTTDIILTKADDFTKVREERYVQFSRSFDTMDDTADTANDTSNRDYFKGITQSLGFASMEDIEQLRRIIEELNIKFEELKSKS